MDKEFNVVTKPRETLNVVCSIQISIGDVFHPRLSLVEKQSGDLYCVQHTLTGLPLPKYLIGEKGDYDNFSYIKLDIKDFIMLESTINQWNGIEHKFHLNPFTFLYATVLEKYNVDLFDIGIFEV